MTNVGKETHHAQFMRVKSDTPLDQFLAALAKGPDAALQLASLEGGPGAVDSAGNSGVTINLQDGQYVVACFVESPDGVPHLAKGMVKPFRVMAPTATAPVVPNTAATFTARDFTYDVPAAVPTGRNTFRFVNQGPQPHELYVVRPAAGKTTADVTQFFFAPPSGPPPFASAGGSEGFGQDGAGFVTLDLQPGEYSAICLIPDPASGKPHIQLGMAKAFTVR